MLGSGRQRKLIFQRRQRKGTTRETLTSTLECRVTTPSSQATPSPASAQHAPSTPSPPAQSGPPPLPPPPPPPPPPRQTTPPHSTPQPPPPPPQPTSHHANNGDPTHRSPTMPHSVAAIDESFVAETPPSSTLPVLIVTGDGFLPSHNAANAISDLFKGHYLQAWTSWTKIPKELRKAWFDDFMGRFSVDAPDDKAAQKIFEMRGAILLKNNLDKARRKGRRPNWLGEEVWDGLCRYWQSDAFKKASSIAKTNRAYESEQYAGPTHVGGSISASQHRFNMEKETGVAPSPIDVFRRTHQRNDQSWANKRSTELMEKYNEEMNQRTQSAVANGDPTPNQLDVWCDVAGIKRGRICGLGLESTVLNPRPRYRGSSSTSAEWRQELEHIRTEKTQMEDRLAITQGQLSDTQNQLANTQGQLSKTEDQLAITQEQLIDTRGRLAINEDELAKTKDKVNDLDACLQEVREFMKNHSISSAQRVALVEQNDHGDVAGSDDDETEPPDDPVSF